MAVPGFGQLGLSRRFLQLRPCLRLPQISDSLSRLERGRAGPRAGGRRPPAARALRGENRQAAERAGPKWCGQEPTPLTVPAHDSTRESAPDRRGLELGVATPLAPARRRARGAPQRATDLPGGPIPGRWVCAPRAADRSS
eukprot:scaffold76075_cov36-Phaeocystis_antarctica.AAC.1